MTIAIPTQDAEPWKDYRSKEVAGYSGYDEIYHSMHGGDEQVDQREGDQERTGGDHPQERTVGLELVG